MLNDGIMPSFIFKFKFEWNWLHSWTAEMLSLIFAEWLTNSAISMLLRDVYGFKIRAYLSFRIRTSFAICTWIQYPLIQKRKRGFLNNPPFWKSHKLDGKKVSRGNHLERISNMAPEIFLILFPVPFEREMPCKDCLHPSNFAYDIVC